MRRGDDVFFFTLIDFLLQVFFFGLLLFAVSQAVAPGDMSDEEKRARKEMISKTGVSSLVELTDLLTKMGPLESLPGTAEYFSKNGGAKNVSEAVAAAGGVDGVRGLQVELDGLKGEVKAWGTPSCIYETVNGRVRPKTIAKIRVTDERIELSEPTKEMNEILGRLGLELSAVKNLSHDSFRQNFRPLVSKEPNCRYFLEVIERPKLLSSMSVVWSAFRTQ